MPVLGLARQPSSDVARTTAGWSGRQTRPRGRVAVGRGRLLATGRRVGRSQLVPPVSRRRPLSLSLRHLPSPSSSPPASIAPPRLHCASSSLRSFPLKKARAAGNSRSPPLQLLWLRLLFSQVLIDQCHAQETGALSQIASDFPQIPSLQSHHNGFLIGRNPHPLPLHFILPRDLMRSAHITFHLKCAL